MTEKNEPLRIGIIGAGLAGLSTASALREVFSAHEAAITVFEGKRIAGGRAGSFSQKSAVGIETTEMVDYCQHVAMGCCTRFIDLVTKHRLADRFQKYDSLCFLHPEHRPSRFKPLKWLPPPLHLLPALLSLRYLTLSQKVRLSRCMWKLMRTPPSQLVTTTAGEWLRSNGQCDQLMTRFWNVILVSALGDGIDAVAMSAARKVIIDGFAVSKNAADVWVPSRPLARLFGHDLVQSLTSQSIHFEFGTPVHRVECDEDISNSDSIHSQSAGPIQLTLQSETTYDFDHVVVAVPWYRMADLLAPSLRNRVDHWQRFSDVAASPITGLHLWSDQRLSERPHAVLVDTRAQWTFAAPLQAPTKGIEQPDRSTDGLHYTQVVISGSDAEAVDREELVSIVTKELRHAFDCPTWTAVRSKMVTDPRSVFSISPDTETIRPRSATNHSRLHLASDFVQTGWPATMEGAVISGRMAASSIAANESSTLPRRIPDLPKGWLAKRIIVD